MPWVKATDAASGLPVQINLDRARTMRACNGGTAIAYSSDIVVIVRERPEDLAAMGRGRWTNVSPMGKDDHDWLNLNAAETIAGTPELTIVTFDDTHEVAVSEPIAPCSSCLEPLTGLSRAIEARNVCGAAERIGALVITGLGPRPRPRAAASVGTVNRLLELKSTFAPERDFVGSTRLGRGLDPLKTHVHAAVGAHHAWKRWVDVHALPILEKGCQPVTHLMTLGKQQPPPLHIQQELALLGIAGSFGARSAAAGLLIAFCDFSDQTLRHGFPGGACGTDRSLNSAPKLKRTLPGDERVPHGFC